MRKAGIPYKRGLQKAEEEHRPWVFPTRKFILNKEEARRLIIETYWDNLYGIPPANA
ncbi:hypothetical protein M1O13_03605 [Dehalococcoidia bacterium]|nr:hypothetical protein [Dehalococcoidia bacterium]